MYFLVNASPPKPLEIALQLYRSHDVLFLFDLILYVPSTIFQVNRDSSSWVEPVLN